MALSEAARAARYQWRADVLAYDDTGDDVKASDRSRYEQAARLAQAVADARPAFQAAVDEIELGHLADMLAWVQSGRSGDKPTMQAAVSSDSSVQIFRSAREALRDYVQSDEFRQTVGRARQDDWDEPTDEELVA